MGSSESGAADRRRSSGAEGAAPPTEPSAPSPEPSSPRTPRPPASAPAVLTAMDFFPLEDPRWTELHAFFENLRAGRFTTTRCRADAKLLWPPRTVCPECHGTDLEWVELPRTGRLYAFSAVLAGAPLGMEAEVPFAVGLADLDGAPLRLFGRIVGAPWNELRIGDPVRVEPFDLPDGRVFYRFRRDSPSTAPTSG